MKILIIGAVAAGTSAAAKARRNSEDAEIKIYEMDGDISYSACGLPYYIGGEIEKLDKLVPRDPEFFKSKYNVDVLTGHKVLNINPDRKIIEVKNLATNEVFTENYDKLIISTGAIPIVPSIQGINKKNVFMLRNVKSAQLIKTFINETSPKRALVIGSGFIGLEMVENLKSIGIEVTVVEMEDHLMKPLDNDISIYIKDILTQKGVKVYLDEAVKELVGGEYANKAILKSDTALDTELIIVAAGIRPNVELASKAGIDLGITGAIKVNSKMETSIRDIYACGDCVEGFSVITGKTVYRPLGSTANKMGRIAGDQVTRGDLEFRGILGTGIFKLFDYTVAQTGLTEREALLEGYEVSVCHNIKPDKPDYFNGEEMLIKAVADRNTGKLLGVQIVGKGGVDKRIDVFATAITFGGKVQDLFHLDLAYAPPFSTTKDPVMYTGMILTNDLERGRKLITAQELAKKVENNESITIIDARIDKQYQQSQIDGSINMPPERLRENLDTLDKENLTVTYCNKGVTGNAAQNILINRGFKKVYNLSGGHKNYFNTKK